MRDAGIPVPPGYPREFDREVILRDGRVVDVRPLIPGDAAELGAAIRAADPETLRRRFLGGPPALTPAPAQVLTVLDYRTRFALVACDSAAGRGVGVARYEHLGDGVAEVAVVVEPGWRRVGVATALVHLLGEAGLSRGICAFTAYSLADNRPVAALVADAGGASFIADGITHLEVALAGATTRADAPRPVDPAAEQDTAAGHPAPSRKRLG